MLVLTRKPAQSIRIGDQITVNIVRVRGNTVQLGIQAPKDVHILRSELLADKPAAGRDSEPTPAPSPQCERGEQSNKDASEVDEDPAFQTIDLELSLYAPEEFAQAELSREQSAQDRFDCPLQQFIFAP